MRGGLCRKKTCTVTVIHYCTDDRQLLIALSSYRSDSQIFVENRNFLLPHLHSAPPLGSPCRNIAKMCGIEKKLEWCGQPDGENYFEDMFIGFNRIQERMDRQTDRRKNTA